MKKLKYSRLKIFHYKEKLDSIPKDKKTILPPLQIRIKPTNVCKHNCWYCAYRADNLQLGKDMIVKDYIPKEKMIEIIDDCADMGVKSITFSGGGDPFHYPYLLDTIKKLSKTSIKFASFCLKIPSIVQYSTGINFLISLSLSTISFRAEL